MLLNAIGTFASIFDGTEDSIKAVGNALKGLSEKTLLAVVSSQKLNAEQAALFLTSAGMSKQQAATAIATLGLSSAEGVATASTFTLTGAMKGLWAIIQANPLISVALGVAAAFAAGFWVMDKLTVTYDEAAEAADDAANAYEETKNELENLNSELTLDILRLLFDYITLSKPIQAAVVCLIHDNIKQQELAAQKYADAFLEPLLDTLFLLKTAPHYATIKW